MKESDKETEARNTQTNSLHGQMIALTAMCIALIIVLLWKDAGTEFIRWSLVLNGSAAGTVVMAKPSLRRLSAGALYVLVTWAITGFLISSNEIIGNPFELLVGYGVGFVGSGLGVMVNQLPSRARIYELVMGGLRSRSVE